MSNDKRGETEIVISGMSYTVRPTFQALRSIEQRTGFGLIALIRQVSTLSISYQNLVVILQEALNETGAPFTEEQVGAAVIDQSMTSFIKPLSVYLGSILTREKVEPSKPTKKLAGENH